MAPRPAAKGQSSLPSRPAASDIHNYDVDDDPFAESGPDEPQSKKRKDASSLGIEEEVAVAKKPRVPRVKLDEARLLSEMGIPRLRRKARDLKFKGKGHEFSDAARLLSFYQLWLDDLFPKAKFLDALAMVEKAGHKKYMRMKRIELIEEGKPKSAATADDEDIFGALNETGEREAAIFPAPLAPIFRNSAGERAKTPAADDDNLFVDDGEDIYGATPKRAKATAAPTNSLFGNGGSAQQNSEAPGEDELDALMAEEETRRTAPPPPQPKSIFGNGNVKPVQDVPDEEDDLDALMAEAEAQADVQPKPSAPKSSSARKSNRVFVEEDEEDDLDAMMAEAEAEGQGQARQIAPTSSAATGSAKTQDAPMNNVDEDEEAAMAEMDGLW